MQAKMPQQQVEISSKSSLNPKDLPEGESFFPRKQTLPEDRLPRKPQQERQFNRPKSNKQTGVHEVQPVTNANSKLSTLRELFPGWSDDDLGIVLQEANQDLEVAIVRISEGRVKPFSQVSKGKKVTVAVALQQPAVPAGTFHTKPRPQSSNKSKDPKSFQKQMATSTNSNSTVSKESPNSWANESASGTRQGSHASGWVAGKFESISGVAKQKSEENTPAKIKPITEEKLLLQAAPIKPDWSRIVGRQPGPQSISGSSRLPGRSTDEVRQLPDVAALSLEEKVLKESSISQTKLVESFSSKSTQIVHTKLASATVAEASVEASLQVSVPLAKNANLISSVPPPPGGLVPGNNANMNNLYNASSISAPQNQQQQPVNASSAASSGFPNGFPVGPRYTNAQTITDLYMIPGATPNSFGYQMPPYGSNYYSPYFYAPPTNPYASGVPPPQYGSQHLMPGSGSATGAHSSKLLSHYNPQSSATSPSSAYSPSHYGPMNNGNNMYNANPQGKFMGMSGNPSSNIGAPQFPTASGQSSFYPQGQQAFSPTSPGSGITGAGQQFDSHIPLNPYYHHHQSHQPVSGAHPHQQQQHNQNVQNMHPNFYSALPLMPNHPYPPHLQGGAIGNAVNQPGTSPSTTGHRALLMDNGSNGGKESVHSNPKNYWTMSQ